MQNNNTPLKPEVQAAVQAAISSLMGVAFCSSHLNLCHEINTDGDALYQLMLEVYTEPSCYDLDLSLSDLGDITIEEWIQMIMFDMFICFSSDITLALPATLPNGEPLSDRTEDIIYTPNTPKEVSNA